MNTTRLHIIAKTLLEELKRVQTGAILQQAVQALENQINQPQQGKPQEQLTSHLTNLYNKLEGSPIDDFSPSWRDAMEELGVADQFGSQLETQVRSIFERNQITTQTALKELKQLHKKVSQTEQQLTGLVSGLEYLNVGEDTLESDQCEVGVIIPRAYVDGNLRKFGAELVEWEKILLVFSEIATGERAPLRVRQISSSELSVFLEYLPEIGACVAIAVERITAWYKQILEIRLLKQQLAERDVPDDTLAGIDRHAESIMRPKIEELAQELVERYVQERLDQHRQNELLTELRHSLNKIANRIDQGVNIEIRPPALEEEEEPEEGEGQPEGDAQTEAIRQIAESATKIEHHRVPGGSVLHLPEGDDNSEENDGVE